MGAYPVLRRFTHDEYLELERASDTRSEYVDGQIYAMAGGTYQHDTLVANTIFLLQSQLKGGSCKVHTSSFRIAVSRQGPAFYPDVSMICGKPEFLDGTQDCALNPTVLIEVLSKSTRKYDSLTKLPLYQQIPVIRDILLISQFGVSVEHHFRGPRGKWIIEKLEGHSATLALKSVSASLPLSELYDGWTRS